MNRPRCLWSGTLGMATTTQGTCCGSCSHYPGRSHRSRSHIVSCSHLSVFYLHSRRGESLIPTPVPTLLDIICTRNEHFKSKRLLAIILFEDIYSFHPSCERRRRMRASELIESYLAEQRKIQTRRPASSRRLGCGRRTPDAEEKIRKPDRPSGQELAELVSPESSAMGELVI